MLKIHIDVPDEDNLVMHTGDAVETAMELAIVCGAVFQGLKSDNPIAAIAFRHFLDLGLKDDSPVWRPQENITILKVKREVMDHE